MPPVKSLDKISQKWADVSQRSQAAYEDGIRNPRGDWAEATGRAEKSYAAGVQKAVAAGRFKKGVEAAGNAKWQKNALEKGPRRWAEGISLSQDAYERGFAPYRAVIENTSLPDRGPVGDPANIDRVRVLAKALHEERLRRQGG